MRIIHPISGMPNAACLLSHFISQGRRLIRKMSAMLSWLATAT